MKLRNKQTGEIVETEEDYFYMTFSNDVRPQDGFTSIKNFNEIWEDYKPAEPLIKDEKIRKAVRAWAEMWGKIFEKEGKEFRLRLFHLSFYTELNCMGLTLSIPLNETLKEGEYTIAELCGEEEE